MSRALGRPQTQVVLTDGNRDALDNLAANLALNGVRFSGPGSSSAVAERDSGPREPGCRGGATLSHEGPERTTSTSASPAPEVVLQRLRWEAAPPEALQAMGADLVVGADVVYDPRAVPALVRVLADLLSAAAPAGDQYSPERAPGGGSWGAFSGAQPGVKCLLQSNATPPGRCQKGAAALTSLPPEQPGGDHGGLGPPPRPGSSSSEATGCGRLNGGCFGPPPPAGRPRAYVATVLRNAATLEEFLGLARSKGLRATDVTGAFPRTRCFQHRAGAGQEEVLLHELEVVADPAAATRGR